MPKKKLLKLEDLKVSSFVTNPDAEQVRGGITGNCLSFVGVTCPEPCDVHTVGDYSCAIDGGCNTPRCGEGTVDTYCGTCDWTCNCPTYCSECASIRPIYC